MDENLNKQFEEITENMALEKLYDQLANRGEFACRIAMHAAEVYKAAREAGLSRKDSSFMARSYWESEMNPGSVYLIGEKEL